MSSGHTDAADPSSLLFTRSGSVRGVPPFPPEIRNCLYTWRERRLKFMEMAEALSGQQQAQADSGFEQCIEVFIDDGTTEIVEQVFEKPMDVDVLRAVRSVCLQANWAFAVCCSTFVRDEGMLDEPTGWPAGTRWANMSHAVMVFDLKRWALAGSCYVPASAASPNAAMVLGAEKLLAAFDETLETAVTISPAYWNAEFEFLPWLLYAQREPRVQVEIDAADVPERLRLTIEEIMFWGQVSRYDEPDGRRGVFPGSQRDAQQLLVGLNYAIAHEGRELDLNVRFCDSGIRRGNPPHIDVQLRDKRGVKGGVDGLKLVSHLQVDLSRFLDLDLRFLLINYAGMRPDTDLAVMLGADVAAELLGIEFAMIRDPAYRGVMHEVYGEHLGDHEAMAHRFNVVYRMDLETSQELEQAVGSAARQFWSGARNTEERMHVARARSRLSLRRLLGVRDETNPPEVAHRAFLAEGWAALRDFEEECRGAFSRDPVASGSDD